MKHLLQDVRYGLRMLRKSPGFAAVAILTLALGIGANTAIFSLVDGILLRALPVRNAQNLVVLKWSARKLPAVHNRGSYGDCQSFFWSEENPWSCSFSEPFFHDVASQVKAFSGVAAFAGAGPLEMSGNGAAAVINGQGVSGGFFDTLGVHPAAGRLIEPSDDSASAPPVLVLNYGYWKERFGGSPSAIGKTVRVNNVPFTIVGVAAKEFDSLSPGNVYDIWLPLSVLPRVGQYPWYKTRNTDPYSWWLVIIGRLKPGVSRMKAQAEVSTLFRNEVLHGAKPFSKPEDDPKVAALPAQDALTGAKRHFSTELYILMAAVGIVLLIACANVAGLLLSRATARQKEMAVRLALGAGRGRIVRQLLTESVLLSLIGGALGILFAVWGVQATVSLMASNSERSFGFSPGIDGRVLAFTFAAAALTGIIFGLAPAFRSARVDLTPALKQGAAGSGTRGGTGRRFSLGSVLVVAQVALAVLALVGAGLLVRTLQNLRNVDPGFDTRNLLTFSLNPRLIGYKTPQIDALYRDLQARISAMPGVESVSYSQLPLLSGSAVATDFHLPDMPKDQAVDADYLGVGPKFISTMHMRLLSGRSFNSADFAVAEIADETVEARVTEEDAKEAGRKTPNPVANTANSRAGSRNFQNGTTEARETPVPVIVNKLFAEKYFPHRNPLGQHFGSDGNYVTYMIVGVVNDAKYWNVRNAIDPTLYVPSSGDTATFEVRTRMSAAPVIAAIRNIVGRMDSNLPVSNVRTQTQIIGGMLAQEHMIARLSGFFGVLALALACIGLYGLLAYEVVRRTREIGIRMALGAQPRDVLRLVVRQGIALAVIGAAIGIVAAIGVTRFMASLLYGVHANDPATIIAVAALLIAVAFAACYIPARRATRVDPMVALRYE